MISIKVINGKRFISFSCIACQDKLYPCISCQQERSVYDMAYLDGKNGVEKIKIGLNSNHNSIFDLGYDHGQESSK